MSSNRLCPCGCCLPADTHAAGKMYADLARAESRMRAAITKWDAIRARVRRWEKRMDRALVHSEPQQEAG